MGYDLAGVIDAQHPVGHTGDHLTGVIACFLQGSAEVVVTAQHDEKIDHPAAQSHHDAAHDHGMLQVRSPGSLECRHIHAQVDGGAGRNVARCLG